MELTRRGLFKTLAGAFVATKAAPLLPVATPPPTTFDPLNTATLFALSSSELLYAYRPMSATFKGFGPVTFDGGDKITQTMIYEFWPPIYVANPRKCAVIKNLG